MSATNTPGSNAISGLVDAANSFKLQLNSYISQTDNTTLIHIIGSTLVIFIAGCIVYYMYYKMTLLPKSCGRLNGKKSAALNSSWITSGSADPFSILTKRLLYKNGIQLLFHRKFFK